jgi:diguanylate cyclase
MQSLEAANQEMAYLSVTDSLTKLNNRRYFDQALLDHFTQAQRTGQYLAVALGDIDHFKVINDTYGHLIGDECLALVAQTIQEQMNAITALTARYGGEEFAIVMMVSEPQQACQVAETVRMAIEKRPFVDRGNTIDLRISIGVAAWIPKTGESAQNMVQAADQALYRAKQAGRNQVVLDDGESN